MEDYFLKIDGIPGESKDAKHKDWIDLVSFSWVVTQPGSGAGGGGGAGRPKFEDFHFVMRVNKASPQLFLASVTGKHIKEASLNIRRPGSSGLEYLKIKFGDILVTSFQETAGEEAPQETIGFNFGRIAMDYTPQQTTETAGDVIHVGWDLSKNVKG